PAQVLDTLGAFQEEHRPADLAEAFGKRVHITCSCDLPLHFRTDSWVSRISASISAVSARFATRHSSPIRANAQMIVAMIAMGMNATHPAASLAVPKVIDAFRAWFWCGQVCGPAFGTTVSHPSIRQKRGGNSRPGYAPG